MASPDDAVVAVFKNMPVHDKAKSQEAGRPIFRDREVVEIRFGGDRNRVGVFPAHAVWKYQPDEYGSNRGITYAERFSAQYQRFKANKQQVQDGTPLDDLPFLTEAKRSELRGLSIYTAEALASLDGQALKSLGQGGRELKNQAQAYLDAATGSSKVTAMASEIAFLKEQVAALLNANNAPKPASPEPVKELAEVVPDYTDENLAGMSDDDLKAFIKEKTGSAPRGNPAHDTLVRMATEARKTDE